MTEQSPPLTDAEIIARTLSGALVADLRAQPKAASTLGARIVDLHNAGQLNILALVQSAEFLELSGNALFRVQHVFSEILPKLDAPYPAMLAAVTRLVMQDGRGGAAILLQEAFRQWLAADRTRAQALVAAAEAGGDLDRQYLAEGLRLLGDVQRAQAFLAFDAARRQAGASALGAMPLPDEAAAQHVVSLLLGLVEQDSDDQVRFTAIFGALSVLERFAGLGPQFIPRLVQAVAARPSKESRIALLQGVWRQTVLFEAANVQAALDTALVGDLTEGELLNMVGVTLSGLLGGAHHALAVTALTRLLAPDDSTITLESLEMVAYRLRELDADVLFALTVGWFATGERRLCDAAAALVGGAQAHAPFTQSLAGFGFTGRQMIVLCHKAIAYLLLTPIVAASFVLASLRAGDKSVQSDLIELLVEPLLLNYGGNLRDYLAKIGRADLAYRAVRKALKAHDLYLKGLTIDPPVKELWPSLSQRTAVRQKRIAMGREIGRVAERQSVFFGMVQRSTLLYGRRSLTYVGGADKAPMEIDLKSISTGIEMPSLDTIDPVGLNYLMRIFRVSKAK